MNIYIRDLTCISPQHTSDGLFLEGTVLAHNTNHYLALEPSYEGVIPSGMLRRMGKAVRMGVGAGLPLLQKHNDCEGIVVGTSEGGVEDSMKFLGQIVQYKEGALTPTNFVQSTANSLAGLLAILSKITGYNATHVNRGLAFEACLADAKLILEEGQVHTLLAGNVEQFSEFNYNLENLNGVYKQDPVESVNLLSSGTPGTVCGEGAVFFVLSDNPANAMAKLEDVGQVSHLQPAELQESILRFLKANGLTPGDVDALVLGYNGDSRTDHWYNNLVSAFFPTQAVYTYKNLVGEYPTVSGFAFWFSVQLLQGHTLPADTIRRKGNGVPARVLVYNTYKGVQHGFMLVRK
jgi:hypothetical protein